MSQPRPGMASIWWTESSPRDNQAAKEWIWQHGCQWQRRARKRKARKAAVFGSLCVFRLVLVLAWDHEYMVFSLLPTCLCPYWFQCVTLLFIHLIFEMEFLFTKSIYISLTLINCEFFISIWTIFEFSLIYSLPEFLKSDTTKELIYGLQKVTSLFTVWWFLAIV